MILRERILSTFWCVAFVALILCGPALARADTIAIQPLGDITMESASSTTDYFYSPASLSFFPSQPTYVYVTSASGFSASFLTQYAFYLYDQRNPDTAPGGTQDEVTISTYTDDGCTSGFASYDYSGAPLSPYPGSGGLWYAFNTASSTMSIPSGIPLTGVKCITMNVTGTNPDGSWANSAPFGSFGDGTTLYYDLEGDGSDATNPGAPGVTTTQITSVQPSDGSTVGSSTAASFSVTGYVAPADYVPGMVVTMTYSPSNSAEVVSALPLAFSTTLTFPLASSGVFDFSTTSPLINDGDYTMNTVIQGASNVNFFGLFSFDVPFSSTNYAATSTGFTVNNQIGIDLFTASTTALIESAYASSTISLASCTSFTSFNLGDCLNVLFVPQPAAMSAVIGTFKGQFLSYFPWGYVTRFFTILSGNGTSSLPLLDVTVATPYSQGAADDTTSMQFDENEILTSAGTDLNSIDANGTSENFQQVLEPFVQLFIAISLLFIIVHDLIGTAHHHRRMKR